MACGGGRFAMSGGRYSGEDRSIVKHAAWPELVGDNSVIDPGMDSGTPPWNFAAGMANALGKQNWSAVAAGAAATNDGVPASAFIPNARYLVSMDISSYVGGEVAIAFGDEVGASYTDNGTNLSEVLTFVPNEFEDGLKILNPAGVGVTTLSLDNVTCQTFQGMGREADWAFTSGTGSVFWYATPGSPSGIFFDGAPSGEKAGLTGSAKEAFDAAVSDSTACSVTLLSVAQPLDGTVQVKLKGGATVDFTFVGDPDEFVTHTVMSGTGSGAEFIAGSDFPAGLLALVIIPGLA